MKRYFVFFLLIFSFLFFVPKANAVITVDYVRESVELIKHAISGDNIGEYSINFNNLNENDYINITQYINNDLYNNNMQKLDNSNLTLMMSDNNLYLIFSNNTSPNNIDNIGFMYIKYNSGFQGRPYIMPVGINNEFIINYIYSTKQKTWTKKIENVVKDDKHKLVLINKDLDPIQLYYGESVGTLSQLKSVEFDLQNTKIKTKFIAGNVLSMTYIAYPFDSDGTVITYPLFIRNTIGKGYINISELEPPTSGDTSGDVEGGGGITGGNITPKDIEKAVAESLKPTNEHLENIEEKIPTSGDIETSVSNALGTLEKDDNGNITGGNGFLGGLWDMIIHIFIPHDDFFSNYFQELSDWFSDRLGLLYYPIDLFLDFMNRCININFDDQVLNIGPYNLPFGDDNFELVPELVFDFSTFVEDENLKFIHDTYLLIVDGLVIFGLVQLIQIKYEEVFKK